MWPSPTDILAFTARRDFAKLAFTELEIHPSIHKNWSDSTQLDIVKKHEEIAYQILKKILSSR